MKEILKREKVRNKKGRGGRKKKRGNMRESPPKRGGRHAEQRRAEEETRGGKISPESPLPANVPAWSQETAKTEGKPRTNIHVLVFSLPVFPPSFSLSLFFIVVVVLLLSPNFLVKGGNKTIRNACQESSSVTWFAPTSFFQRPRDGPHGLGGFFQSERSGGGGVG